MPIVFELPGLPATTNKNGRKHWAILAREARTWKGWVAVAVAAQRPKMPLQQARITLTRCSSVESDFDGLVSSFKHVLDGLVSARVIANDKPSCIGQPQYRWERAAPRMGKIRVEIWDTDLINND